MVTLKYPFQLREVSLITSRIEVKTQLEKCYCIATDIVSARKTIDRLRQFSQSTVTKMAALRVFSRNLPYLRQQFSALLGNTSPSVKFICVVVVIGYVLSFSEDVVNVLSVTPGYLLPPSFHLWSTFTFWFLEIHLWEVVIDIVTVGLCGKLIEPLWGQMEMMKFFFLTNFGVAFLTTFYYLVIFACTGQAAYLFDIHVHGLAGYLAAVSVAVKQILPDHLLVKTPLGMTFPVNSLFHLTK